MTKSSLVGESNKQTNQSIQSPSLDDRALLAGSTTRNPPATAPTRRSLPTIPLKHPPHCPHRSALSHPLRIPPDGRQLRLPRQHQRRTTLRGLAIQHIPIAPRDTITQTPLCGTLAPQAPIRLNGLQTRSVRTMPTDEAPLPQHGMLSLMGQRHRIVGRRVERVYIVLSSGGDWGGGFQVEGVLKGAALPWGLFLLLARGARCLDCWVLLPADGTGRLSPVTVLTAERIVGVVDWFLALEAHEASLGFGLFKEVRVELVGAFREFNSRIEYLKGLQEVVVCGENGFFLEEFYPRKSFGVRTLSEGVALGLGVPKIGFRLWVR